MDLMKKLVLTFYLDLKFWQFNPNYPLNKNFLWRFARPASAGERAGLFAKLLAPRSSGCGVSLQSLTLGLPPTKFR
jgi:hypothetical protein